MWYLGLKFSPARSGPVAWLDVPDVRCRSSDRRVSSAADAAGEGTGGVSTPVAVVRLSGAGAPHTGHDPETVTAVLPH